MPRNIQISRDEAELMVDLLLLSDHHCAKDLAEHLREEFGMISEHDELSRSGKSIQDVRRQFLEEMQNRLQSP